MKIMRILCVILFFLLPFFAKAQKNNSLIFISDIQEPMWLETLKLKPENNRDATSTLFTELSKQDFAALFLLGDMVSAGSGKKWKRVDQLISSIISKNIPVYATIGNHEYIFNKSRGVKKFVQRFGYESTIGFVQTIDFVSVVLLNSNISKLTDKEQQQQMSWYTHIMDSLQHADEIKAIIVCTHHSPYTNSTIVKPSVEVGMRFIPLFLQTGKAHIFLSGHSHNLEYFQNEDKHFLVIGGGGGLAQPVQTQEKGLLYSDLLYNKPKPRFFYLEVKCKSNELIVETHGFPSNDFSIISTMEICRIAL